MGNFIIDISGQCDFNVLTILKNVGKNKISVSLY